jgi:hypothetical protein
MIHAMRECLVKTLTFCLLTDAGCIITHHDHGCIDKKAAGSQAPMFLILDKKEAGQRKQTQLKNKE